VSVNEAKYYASLRFDETWPPVIMEQRLRSFGGQALATVIRYHNISGGNVPSGTPSQHRDLIMNHFHPYQRQVTVQTSTSNWFPDHEAGSFQQSWSRDTMERYLKGCRRSTIVQIVRTNGVPAPRGPITLANLIGHVLDHFHGGSTGPTIVEEVEQHTGAPAIMALTVPDLIAEILEGRYDGSIRDIARACIERKNQITS
jgi:hypothetical protein